MTQRSYHTGVKVFFIFIGLHLLIPSYGALPCTLFGAIGDSVDGGGVLIGKTRDRTEQLEQVFIEVSSQRGFRYRGIATKGAKRVTSGINEKGLVVVSATASGLEKEARVTTVGKILSKASTVDDVAALVQQGKVQGPIFYLVGDIQKLALIEVMDGQRHGIQVREKGVLYHTNHFILKEMERFNQKIGTSSRVRLSRIEELLKRGPFNKDQFVIFSQDHFNGPGNCSICRHFETGVQGGEKTNSAAVYYLRKGDPPQVWVSMGQPCQSVSKNH